MPSLKKSLTPSASVMRTPNGPARFGPIRVWKSAMTLRSIQTRSITEISRTKNTTTIRAARRSQPVRSTRSPSVRRLDRHGGGEAARQERVGSQPRVVERNEHGSGRDVRDDPNRQDRLPRIGSELRWFAIGQTET